MDKHKSRCNEVILTLGNETKCYSYQEFDKLYEKITPVHDKTKSHMIYNEMVNDRIYEIRSSANDTNCNIM